MTLPNFPSRAIRTHVAELALSLARRPLAAGPKLPNAEIVLLLEDATGASTRVVLRLEGGRVQISAHASDDYLPQVILRAHLNDWMELLATRRIDRGRIEIYGASELLPRFLDLYAPRRSPIEMRCATLTRRGHGRGFTPQNEGRLAK